MTQSPKPSETHTSKTPPQLTIDWDAYGQYLEGSDLSDDQKIELIETLWSIVVSFVDLGFGVASSKESGDGDVDNNQEDHE